jgi:Zn-dependent membrane protease YugP
MPYLIIIFVLLAAVLGPSLWVNRIMSRYSKPVDRYPNSGGEVARRLLDELGLQDVGTEITEKGDHYDPAQRMVRLSRQNYEDGSLTAITIAAHEVGHALQHASGYMPLMWRTRLVRWVGPVEKTGAALLMATPLIIGITRAPIAGLLMAAGGLLTLGSGVVMHLLTLPTEFDASFGRAMPLLKQQNILAVRDEPHARRLLQAAALTYVSASLMSLLNVARWWAILRR